MGSPSPTTVTPQLKKLRTKQWAPVETALQHTATWLHVSPWTPENAIKKRPVLFLRCSLNEGVTLDRVAVQEATNVKQLEGAGLKGTAVICHAPYTGLNETPDFDFVMNYYWYSFDARAHAAQNYGAFAAENPEGQEAMEELVSCEGTSSFVFETMFNNLPDTEG